MKNATLLPCELRHCLGDSDQYVPFSLYSFWLYCAIVCAQWAVRVVVRGTRPVLIEQWSIRNCRCNCTQCARSRTDYLPLLLIR